MDLTQSKTFQNLKTAFAGESEARNKYTYYSSKAKKDGYEQIGSIFEETANNEKEHAKLWFKLLHGGDVPTTSENLLEAAQGEKHEWTTMYQDFAQIAKDEGFNDIAVLFAGVAKIEKEHEQRYIDLLNNIKNNKVFEKEEKVFWVCRNCGHVHFGKNAPEICPVCKHPKSFFEKKNQNY